MGVGFLVAPIAIGLTVGLLFGPLACLVAAAVWFAGYAQCAIVAIKYPDEDGPEHG